MEATDNSTDQVTTNLSAARAIIVVAVAVAGLTVFVVASEILMILSLGVLFGIFLINLASWTSKKTSVSYRWSLAVVVLGLVFLVGISVTFFFVQINHQVEQASSKIEEGIGELRSLIDRYPAAKSAVGSIPFLADALQAADSSRSGQNEEQESDSKQPPQNNTSQASNVDLATVSEPVKRAASTIGQIFKTTFGLAVNSLLIAFVGLFLAISPTSYRDGVIQLVPIRHRDRATEVMNELGDVLWSWLVGRMATMLMTGLGAFLLLAVIGVPMAGTLGILTGLLAFIPNIGAAISLMLAVLFASPQGLSTVGMVVGAYLALQMLESYVLTPLIQKYQVSLPPALLISCQAVMGVLFGFLGAAVASPALAVGKTLVQMIYIEDYLGDDAAKE